MKILVTGGAGFIGSNFVRRTLEDAYPGLEGAEVVVLDALTYSGNLENLAPVADSPRYQLRAGRHPRRRPARRADADGRRRRALRRGIARRPLGARRIGIFVETNVLGTQQLLDAALRAGLGRFVHVSTDEVYGSIAEGSWDEERPLEPNSPYSASKAGSDLLARSYYRTHGLNVSITRCSNNYGPYHFPEKVIPLFVTNLIDDKHVPLYGEGNNIRDWLHVDDHTRGIAMVLTGGRAGEIYNIGGGTELTNKELTELLLDATGKDWSYVDRVADRLGHDLRYSVDISKIQAELGYEPLVPFETGPRRRRAVVPRQPRSGGSRSRPARRCDPVPGRRRRRHARPRPRRGSGGPAGDDARPQLSSTSPTRRRCATPSPGTTWSSTPPHTRASTTRKPTRTRPTLVNAVGAANLAAAAADAGAILVQVSTDYVFDGSAVSPYAEGRPAQPRLRLRAHQSAAARRSRSRRIPRPYIVRTAWLYGEHGPNFAEDDARARRAARHGDASSTTRSGQPDVDPRSRPPDRRACSTPGLVPASTTATATGETSWFGFARAVFELAGLDPDRVLPTDSSQFVRPAPRPAYSVLGHDAWATVGLGPMRPWREALADAFAKGALP